MNSPTVVYLVGAARSGSTLLASLLGQLDGFTSVGELRTIWWNTHARRCSCGVPLRDCPVWHPVLSRLSNRLDLGGDPAPAMIAAQGEATRLRHLPGILLAQRGLRKLPAAALRYREWLEDLYAAVAEATGATVIVDASKSPTEAGLLASGGTSPVHVLQLVRDPRAVVSSWYTRPGRGELGPYARTAHPRPSAVALNWTGVNLAAHLVRASIPADCSSLLRYEDLAVDPLGAVEAVAADLGRGGAAGLDMTGPVADLRPGHSVGGGRTVQRSGPTQISVVNTWRDSLPGSVQALTSALSWPLAARYGYTRRSSSAT